MNLRRRLQRILATHEKLERPDQPLPDNRQMAALVAEAEIVWEIDKWERFRIIYPNKPEMQYIPPGGLEHDESHHSASGSGGTDDRSEENSAEGGLLYSYAPAHAPPLGVTIGVPRYSEMGAPLTLTPGLGVTVSNDGGLLGFDPLHLESPMSGKGGFSGKGSKGKGKGIVEVKSALSPSPFAMAPLGMVPPDLHLKVGPPGTNPLLEAAVPSMHGAHYPVSMVPHPVMPFIPPTPEIPALGMGLDAEVPSPLAKDVPKEPTRIVNLRRRLHRIQNTKAKLAWGPQPDNRQLAALEAEPAILWEIQQWEQFGILSTKPEGPEPGSGSGGDHTRDCSTLTEGRRELQEEESLSVDHWVQAVEEAHAEERRRHQQIARRERAARQRVRETAMPEDSKSSSDTSDGDDATMTENSDMRGRRRELFNVLSSRIEDSVMTRIRRRGGSLLDTKYYRQGDGAALHPRLANGKHRQDGVEDLVAEPTWLPVVSELKVTPGLAPKPTHFLENSWTIWFDESEQDDQSITLNNYREIFTELGSFNTIQGFWMYWNNLRVNNLRENCNLRLFKSEIKPTWEDPHNRSGGRWVAQNIPKAKRSKLWGDIVMAMVGELTEDNSHESICGVVLSTRQEGDEVQLWIDGGYLYRTRPDLYQAEEDFRDTRATMQKLAEICDFDDDVQFVYQGEVNANHPLWTAAPLSSQSRN